MFSVKSCNKFVFFLLSFFITNFFLRADDSLHRHNDCTQTRQKLQIKSVQQDQGKRFLDHPVAAVKNRLQDFLQEKLVKVRPKLATLGGDDFGLEISAMALPFPEKSSEDSDSLSYVSNNARSSTDIIEKDDTSSDSSLKREGLEFIFVICYFGFKFVEYSQDFRS